MYTVFGYTDDCRDFKFKFNSFVKAVNAFKKLNQINITFIMRGNDPKTCMFVK
jgi:hypothetical protein